MAGAVPIRTTISTAASIPEVEAGPRRLLVPPPIPIATTTIITIAAARILMVIITLLIIIVEEGVEIEIGIVIVIVIGTEVAITAALLIALLLLCGILHPPLALPEAVEDGHARGVAATGSGMAAGFMRCLLFWGRNVGIPPFLMI